MARQFTDIDPEPTYRAAIFYTYSGLHNLPMRVYTDINGQSYNYHRVYVFGPYEKPGPAKAMVKREVRYAGLGYRNFYDHADPARPMYDVSGSHGIIETSTPVWGFHA